ncbi:hypothetical protein OMD49_25810 [Bacillus anthracis]|nr:hypothetical protein [Bacillus anthracis]
MMLLKALEKVQLPLSFKTTIGYGTGHERVYNISPSQLGYLYAYTPAVNEKGKVTFGEVYLVLKGNQKRLVVKILLLKELERLFQFMIICILNSFLLLTRNNIKNVSL